MTEALAAGMPNDIDLVRGMSEREDRGLMALSVPEAVTDALAVSLLEACGLGQSARRFAGLIRSCAFVVDRNGEWRLSDDAKTYLQPLCFQAKELWFEVNSILFDLAKSAGARDESLPTYLRDPAGRAYHLAAIDPEAGTATYSDLAVAAEFDGDQSTTWLANRLARDQQQLGVLPNESTALDFLNAMSLYSDGARSAAIEGLRPVAAAKGASMPIAVACHLVGRWDGDRRSDVDYRIAVKMLRRSIRIGEQLGNALHVAQAQHSLALILLINDREQKHQEAHALLDKSLQTLLREHDSFGAAKVLHTYGQSLGRSSRASDWRQAQGMMLQSLRIGEALGKRRHETLVMRSLADLLDKTNSNLAGTVHVLADRMGSRDMR
ncbi:hypothetical protein SAMN04489844_0247 [Nocardioides exalbidus]|uniref:MalT-like TPR region domain-containing protein n=1 Tax=Nocardioides exalbidus TaxID=402596 RepID=A0A1H4JQ72_9ACTN|nr:hypothetical protein [Nocardioides exalbidus]SEB48403.1 hypothetical protein SAMN04489844_0247 [Nocardioides exalbidus]